MKITKISDFIKALEYSKEQLQSDDLSRVLGIYVDNQQRENGVYVGDPVVFTEDDQHLKLLSTLKNHRGPVILSGYNSDLYAEELKGRSKIEFDSATGNVGRKKKIAIECLWYNFDPVEQMELFKLEV